MKILEYLFLSKGLVLIFSFTLPFALQAEGWADDIQIDGFARQGFFYTSDNNVHGQSNDGTSVGLTEIGLNISYQLFDRLSLSAQAKGSFDANPAFATQLSYELNGGEYVFSVSYLDLVMKYAPSNNESKEASGGAAFRPLLFSTKYNGEKMGLTAEYQYRWNKYGGFMFSNFSFISDSWYVQGSYRFFPWLQAVIRYDASAADIDDKKGKRQKNRGVSHFAFSQGWVAGLRWDITSSWMMRVECHRVHGTGLLAWADNEDDLKKAQDWNLYASQLSFRV